MKLELINLQIIGSLENVLIFSHFELSDENRNWKKMVEFFNEQNILSYFTFRVILRLSSVFIWNLGNFDEYFQVFFHL